MERRCPGGLLAAKPPAKSIPRSWSDRAGPRLNLDFARPEPFINIGKSKPRLTRDLAGAISLVTRWKTVDWDADGRPRRQVAEVPFRRRESGALEARVIAVRTLDRTYARHIYLWDDLDYTVQVN
jgi:hypothetical protein